MNQAQDGPHGAADMEGKIGRPSIGISRENVQNLQEKGFTASQMAKFFGCSVSLVYTTLRGLGLSQRKLFSTLTDNELDALICSLHAKYPNAGVKMMSSYLLTEGKKVQRQRVRDSLLRVDAESAADRHKKAISRRQYKVATPNTLWHMDGHMKLIRWGITTHGCIDGYSRLVVFLNASTNNRASTVFRLFLAATLEFGLPSLVRSDHGGENKHVALFMNIIRGATHHITGKSVHNQRIERLWRDVHTQVTGRFYNIFYQLEDEEKLDINNEVHMKALHVVFLPELNNCLCTFQRGWNKHGIRTEGNKTPEQLWMAGSLENATKDISAINSIFGNEITIEQQLHQGLQHYGLNLDQFQDVQLEDENQDGLGVEDILDQQDKTVEEKFLLTKSRLLE